MLIREIGPFTVGRFGFWSDRPTPRTGACLGPFDLCRILFSEWFDVDEAKPLWVRIHSRLARDRLEVIGGSEDGFEGCTLRLVDKNGDFEDLQMCPGWVRDLDVTYPYYVEIVQ